MTGFTDHYFFSRDEFEALATIHGSKPPRRLSRGGRLPGPVIIHIHTDQCRGGHCSIPLEPPLAVAISQLEQDHIDALRRQSYELSVARGHMRRG